MTRVESMLRAGRIVVLGIFCILLLQGCSHWGKRERAMMMCGDKLGVPIVITATAEEVERMEKLPDGIVAPGGCWRVNVSGAVGEANGWLELSGANGLPTGNFAPQNAKCIAGMTKCGFPGTGCTKVGGGQGHCTHAIYNGAGAYGSAQACTCYCN